MSNGGKPAPAFAGSLLLTCPAQAEAREASIKIEDLSSPDAEHSTGLILRWRGQLLFAVEPARRWRQATPGASASVVFAHLIGIGGHVEPGESWGEAVLREAREEAGLTVSLAACGTTYLFSDDGAVSDISARLDWPDGPRPWFIWSMFPGFEPTPQVRLRHLLTAVFAAVVPDDVEPHPGSEVPAIIAVSEAHVRRAVGQPACLGELMADGARIWESTTVPRSALLVPAGSAYWYAMLLAKHASYGQQREGS